MSQPLAEHEIRPSPKDYDPEAIRAALSEVRFEPYLASAQADLSAALDLYIWNARLAGALLEELHLAEVVVRNAMIGVLRQIASDLGRFDQVSAPWYEMAYLGERQLEEVQRARERLCHDGLPADEGHLVADLPFGFWRNLVSCHDERLWERGLCRVFAPYDNSPEHCRQVEDALEELSHLRNRIAHHEPIFRIDHAACHDRIIEVVGWVSPDACAWIAEVGRVLAVSAQAPSAARRR